MANTWKPPKYSTIWQLLEKFADFLTLPCINTYTTFPANFVTQSVHSSPNPSYTFNITNHWSKPTLFSLSFQLIAFHPEFCTQLTDRSTHLLIPRGRDPFVNKVKKFPTSHRTHRWITMFKIACHWSFTETDKSSPCCPIPPVHYQFWYVQTIRWTVCLKEICDMVWAVNCQPPTATVNVGHMVDKVVFRCFYEHFSFPFSITPPVLHAHSFTDNWQHCYITHREEKVIINEYITPCCLENVPHRPPFIQLT